MDMDTVYRAGEIACYVIAGSVVTINLIAPFTKNETDNKVARAQTWINDKLQAFVLPFLRSKNQPKS